MVILATLSEILDTMHFSQPRLPNFLARNPCRLLFLYSMVLSLLQPFVLLRLLIKSRSNPAYRQRIAERYGYNLPPCQGSVFWIHTVSVGEFNAARPLIERLLTEYPQKQFLVTCTTPTGSARIREEFSSRVVHSYLPQDLAPVWRRFMCHYKPEILLCMETEIWPNLYRKAHESNIPVVLINARMSKKSARAYRLLQTFFADIFQAVTTLVCQSKEDLQHFVELHMQAQENIVCGNLKFELAISKEQLENAKMLEKNFPPVPRWVAASTHPGEEALVLDTHKKLMAKWPGLQLILAPRHPERWPELARLCEQKGLRYDRLQNYLDQPVSETCPVVLVDRMNWLFPLFAINSISFIGGSMVTRGGHNPLEPASLGNALVQGIYTFNFSSLAKAMNEANAIREVQSPGQLFQVVDRWLSDPREMKKAGAQALAFFERTQGATDCTLDLIRKTLNT